MIVEGGFEVVGEIGFPLRLFVAARLLPRMQTIYLRVFKIFHVKNFKKETLTSYINKIYLSSLYSSSSPPTPLPNPFLHSTLPNPLLLFFPTRSKSEFPSKLHPRYTPSTPTSPHQSNQNPNKTHFGIIICKFKGKIRMKVRRGGKGKSRRRGWEKGVGRRRRKKGKIFIIFEVRCRCLKVKGLCEKN